jgi:hypothetical protein
MSDLDPFPTLVQTADDRLARIVNDIGAMRLLRDEVPAGWEAHYPNVVLKRLPESYRQALWFRDIRVPDMMRYLQPKESWRKGKPGWVEIRESVFEELGDWWGSHKKSEVERPQLGCKLWLEGRHEEELVRARYWEDLEAKTGKQARVIRAMANAFLGDADRWQRAMAELGW